jgi:putative hemolysin
VSELSTLLALLVLVAWLTAGATAVRSVSRIWLRHWVERRLNGSATAAAYLDRPQRLLLVAGAGVAIAVCVAGMLIAVDADADPMHVALRIAAAAIVLLVLGQLVPRAIARRWAPRLVPVLLPVLRMLDFALAPILGLARGVARLVVRAPARTPDEETRDDIEELLREGELEGVGEKDEIAIITGVVHFGEKTIADVMTPREQVFALDASLAPEEMARRIAHAGYSRVPLYRGSLDDVVGMTHAFDVLKAGGDVAPRVRPVGRTSPDRHCNELLFEMLRKRLHLAVVADAAGATVGIVTMEDLLEELVGDIRDEHDEPAGAAPQGPPSPAVGAAASAAPSAAGRP